MKNNFILLFYLVCFINTSLFAQNFFSELNYSPKDLEEKRYIIPSKFKTFKIQHLGLEALLNSAKLDIETSISESKKNITLPLPNGEEKVFKFIESPVMSPILSAKYPSLRTYIGESIEKGMTVRFDYSPSYGFHAMIIGVSEVILIDPYSLHNPNHVISYYKKDYTNSEKQEFEELKPLSSSHYEHYLEYKSNHPVQAKKQTSGNELKTYRIAIACTQQYSNFHGGTTESTLAGIVTTMNRVNQIYENEVAIRMILVDNNDELIEYSLNWGMSNNNTGQLINQSQEVIEEFIGSDNYDIGHTFSTGAGGLASLGVPCNSDNKAKGVTGTNSPIGDAYDVDYVAHEIGHQFGGNHTFNGSSGSCDGNRNAETAYEPGSGSTIMAYAGICSSHNIQTYSDPYFHPASFDEIKYYINSAYGSSCALVTETGNTPPEAFIEDKIYTIPFYTAFELDGIASDADEDIISYSWIELDLGPSGHPNSPFNNAPIFRAFTPKEVSKRIFPKINDLIYDMQIIGETMPSYARTMNFRMTARDNRAGGGGIGFDETQIIITEQSGPFEVLKPNGFETWGINSTFPVEWSVADTDQGAVNSSEVDIILMYRESGEWLEIVLAENEINDGFADVFVPNMDVLIGSQNRIKIKPTNNIYFDISNDHFAITGMSTAEIGKGQINLFPNPNQGQFQICVSKMAQEEISINIIDLSGKIIYSRIIKPISNNEIVDMEIGGLGKGLYFIEIFTNEEKVTQTISIL